MRWIGGQANQVEQEKEAGSDDIRPATHRLGQYQGQENHQDRNQHQDGDPQPNELVKFMLPIFPAANRRCRCRKTSP